MSIFDTVIVNIFLIYKWISGQPNMTKAQFITILIKEIIEHCKEASLKTKNDKTYVSSDQMGFKLGNEKKQQVRCSIVKAEKRGKCLKCNRNSQLI